MNHRNLQVRCANDEPVELLRDKLASKSGELYIFWVLLQRCSKTTISSTMRIMRNVEKCSVFSRRLTGSGGRGPTSKLLCSPPNKYFTKSATNTCKKVWISTKQRQFHALTQFQRMSTDIRQLKKENQKYHDDNSQLQILIQELRNENAIQKKHIEKILEQLRIAQNEINTMAKVYDELGQKEMILSRYVAKEK